MQPTNMYLICKEDLLNNAIDIFKEMNISVTSQGQRYLGAVLGERSFVETYVKNMVEKWTHKIEILFNLFKFPLS